MSAVGETTDSSRLPRGAYAFLAAALLVLALLLSDFFVLTQNTLARNWRWEVTKYSGLKTGVMGGRSFWDGSQALAGKRLNLDAWFGFHEVLYGERLVGARVSFLFWLDRDAYCNLVLRNEDDSSSAVRLSVNEQFPSAFLRVRDTNEFEEVQPLELPDLQPGSWHRCDVTFDSSRMHVWLNGRDLGNWTIPSEGHRQFGFRGSRRAVRIDNVVIDKGDGSKPLLETFVNRKGLWKILVISFAGLVLVELCVAFLLNRLKTTRKNIALSLCMLSFVGIVVVGAAAPCYSHVWAARHPTGPAQFIDPSLLSEWLSSLGNETNKRIEERHSKGTPQGTSRILFLGTSQTRGSGATIPDEAFVRVVERGLNATPASDSDPSKNYECINAGTDGFMSNLLLERYRKDWIEYEPSLVVINLSNNDGKADVFEQSLRELVSLNRSRGISTLLTLEANSIEDLANRERTVHLAEMHAVMRRVASSESVPLLDLNKYLAERHDTGFLWWDRVHPTSWGHQLIAEALLDPIRKALDAES